MSDHVYDMDDAHPPRPLDYEQGYIDGLTAYAWWKDGVQYVGTTGTSLQEAIDRRHREWNYKGPEK